MEKKAKIEIEYSKNAYNFFEEHLLVKENFIEKLKALYIFGDKNVDIKILKGITPRQYRMRIGDYRIIFNVTKKIVRVYSIFVLKADSRGNIYKK